jgi:hypothetical protein
MAGVRTGISRERALVGLRCGECGKRAQVLAPFRGARLWVGVREKVRGCSVLAWKSARSGKVGPSAPLSQIVACRGLSTKPEGHLYGFVDSFASPSKPLPPY